MSPNIHYYKAAAAVATLLRSIIMDGTAEWFEDNDDLLDVANAWTMMGWWLYEGDYTARNFFWDHQSDTGTGGGSRHNAISAETGDTGGADPKTLNILTEDSSDATLKVYKFRGVFGDSQSGIANPNWVHFTMTWDGTLLKVYVDGVETEPESKATDNSGTMTDSPDRRVMIGSDEPETFRWKGKCGHQALFDSVLTSAEVEEIWNGGLTIDLTSDSGDYVSSSDLVHYWRFGDDEAVNPTDLGVGPTDRTVTATSISAPANISTDVPDGTRGEDRSVLLNGTDEDWENAGNETFAIADTWSISQWVRPINLPSTQTYTFRLDSTASNNSLIIVTNLNTTKIRLFTRDDAGAALKDYRWDQGNEGTFANNTWIHMVFTWNGTTLLGYFDGVNDTTQTKTIDNSGTMNDQARKFTIGSNAGGQFMEGNFGHFAMWDVVLDQNDVDEIFNPAAGKPFRIDLRVNTGTYDKSADLQHYWKPGFSDIGEFDRGDIAGTLRHLTSSAGIDNTNIVTEAPA